MKRLCCESFLLGLIALLTISIIVGAASDSVPVQRNSAQRPPNFIVLMGEGQGWNSTSVQMDDAMPASKSNFVQTPNLERLAREGMRFANAYAASPRCTPSRAALLTGKSAALLRMTFVGQGARGEADDSRKLIPPQPSLELPEAETTIAELLKGAGYATAYFGKWHVGRLNPSRHGFDENDGANNNGGPENSGEPNPKQAYLTTEKGIDFVTRQTKAGKPFLLQISQYAGRNEAEAKPETVEAVRKRGGDARQIGTAAVAEDVDINIGLLLKKLDELGIAVNTYVIYTTDHGSPGRGNGPLNNGKGSLLEGGIRVPFLIRGPGVKAGVCSHTRVTSIDLLPTIAELANLKTPLPKSIEGGSLAPVLLGDGKAVVKRSREDLIFHFPHYDLDNDGPASVLFLDNLKAYKSYETGELRLFDLSKDIGERNDLVKQMPDKAAEMERRLNEYLKAVNAQMPTVNSNYDPSKATADNNRRRNRRRN
ncbi:MAG TPA: sulfatase [Blastocatellia bacterium]|nr:sulfatase [Blastocatellia bacterium]